MIHLLSHRPYIRCRRHLTTSLPRALSSLVGEHVSSSAKSLPPGFNGSIANLETFQLPEKVCGSPSDWALGGALIDTWRREGVLQFARSAAQLKAYEDANAASREFFARPYSEKISFLNDSSYSGYTASGEEVTNGVADYPEIFTVYNDISSTDLAARRQWPCHGPCPWPNATMKKAMERYMAHQAKTGKIVIALMELGLGIPTGSLAKYTANGWDHLRVLRFPARDRTNGKGKDGRGIGSHTDYGLLVIGQQDGVGGLFVRPPRLGDESYSNWEKYAAGFKEDDCNWLYVPPTVGTSTIILGDMMQYMTNGFLHATPHKVGLNTNERFSFAYFHEPNFRAVVKPLPGYAAGQNPVEGIHYGTHFTNMSLQNFPDRETTRRIISEGRYDMLSTSELRLHI